MKTVAISESAHRTIKRWAKVKGLTVEKFMDSWIENVALKKQQEFYNSLPDPRVIKSKPLENVKIR
jgi:hypothetical protein